MYADEETRNSKGKAPGQDHFYSTILLRLCQNQYAKQSIIIKSLLERRIQVHAYQGVKNVRCS